VRLVSKLTPRPFCRLMLPMRQKRK